MAKRTKLTAPSADDLAKLDADFRSENRVRPNPATAPIAQVAAESAALGTGEGTQDKLNRLDAARLREAEEKGLLITEIATDAINADAMIRDRTVIDKDELAELRISIRSSGLRLPIEVYATEDGGYALLSGYRRLLAVRGLHEAYGEEQFLKIKAILRPKTDIATSFSAMVEENEIRSSLSHFERGRIAVIAAQQQAFSSTEEAITKMFKAASAAKRSKIKAFAEVFEVLGDLLRFPQALTERRGLRLSNALRQGAEAPLRAALEAGQGTTPDLEWAVLDPIIAEVEAGPVKVAKRGRPKVDAPTGWSGNDTLRLSSGITLRKTSTPDGYAIHFSGKTLHPDMVDAAMERLRYYFDNADS